jgi:hypothetical protein
MFPATWRQILGPAPTRGDYATVLIAAPVGLVVDGLLTIHGIPSPGVASLTTASVALGVKRAVQPPGKRRKKVLKEADQLIIVLEEIRQGATTDEDASIVDHLIVNLQTHIKLCHGKVRKPDVLEAIIEETVKRIGEVSYTRGSPAIPARLVQETAHTG